MTGTDDAVRQRLETLGGFIRARREQADLSLRDLAARTNVSNPYLSQLERGLHEPSLRVLQAIGTALNVPLEALLAAAGVLSGRDGESLPDTERAILADEALTDDQRQSLLAVYHSYVDANLRSG